MLQTVEAIIEQNGMVHLLEPLCLAQRVRAIVTVLEPTEKPIVLRARPLREFIGVLKNSSTFTGDPVAIQQAMRNELLEAMT